MNGTIYLLSGLGADHRIFQHLHFGPFTPKHIHWLEPNPQEPLTDYARRLSAQIEGEAPILLGVSFGGMVAVEIAKQRQCQTVILISSAATRAEVPAVYRNAGRLCLHRLLPVPLLKQANFLTYWFFGMHTAAERALLKNILRDTDGRFLRWAMDAIVRWENTETLPNLLRLHGTADRILPIRNIRHVDARIPGGGHLMIFNRAGEINEALLRLLRAG